MRSLVRDKVVHVVANAANVRSLDVDKWRSLLCKVHQYKPHLLAIMEVGKAADVDWRPPGYARRISLLRGPGKGQALFLQHVCRAIAVIRDSWHALSVETATHQHQSRVHVDRASR